MKKNILGCCFVAILLLAGCQKQTDAPKADTPKMDAAQTSGIPKPDTKPAPSAEPMCYLFAEGPDSTFIEIKIADQKATGDMAWIPHEKDGASGAFEGTYSDNVVKAIWTATIEGSTMKEEIELKMEGDKLMRKLGELEEKNGVMVLKDAAKAPYSETYTKMPCQKK